MPYAEWLRRFIPENDSEKAETIKNQRLRHPPDKAKLLVELNPFFVERLGQRAPRGYGKRPVVKRLIVCRDQKLKKVIGSR